MQQNYSQHRIVDKVDLTTAEAIELAQIKCLAESYYTM